MFRRLEESRAAVGRIIDRDGRIVVELEQRDADAWSARLKEGSTVLRHTAPPPGPPLTRGFERTAVNGPLVAEPNGNGNGRAAGEDDAPVVLPDLLPRTSAARLARGEVNARGAST